VCLNHLHLQVRTTNPLPSSALGGALPLGSGVGALGFGFLGGAPRIHRAEGCRECSGSRSDHRRGRCNGGGCDVTAASGNPTKHEGPDNDD
jgi:hypothetical protein